MVTDAQLAGYVLEELLASLLQESGYELLSRPDDDPDTLDAEGHGLVVKGRGCTHQVDALGTLAAPVPFGLPLRMFVEAKHRLTEAVGIEVVRNAYGVLADVNQFCPDGATSRRVAYQYSLVSTRGFSPRAVAYARTHGIALHDFSGDAWGSVRRTVDDTVKVLKPFLRGSSTAEPVPLTSVRRLLRAALGTLERSDGRGLAPREDADAASTTRRIRAEAGRAPVKGTVSRSQLSRLVPHLVALAQRHDRSLLIGYPDGQLVLALRPDRTDALDHYLRTHARVSAGGAVVPVRLVFSPAGGPGRASEGEAPGDWVVEPTEHPGAFRLRIGLPEGFETGLLTTDGASPRPGWRDGSITVHRRGVAYRLVYELEVTEEGRGGQARALRARRIDRSVAITSEALQPETRRTGGPGAADGSGATPPAPAPTRPRSPRAVVPAAGVESVADESRWDTEEVSALLALLEERATAPPGRRRSVARAKTRASAGQALVLLHALARAGGGLDRVAVCALLGNDPTDRFKRGTSGVTAAAKTLKGRRGVVAQVRGDVLTSTRGGRRAGSGGVTCVVVREEFVEPLKAQARRMARADAEAAAGRRPPTSRNATAVPPVPPQRSRRAVTKER